MNVNKYKAVIFDLDGVICHTDQYHYNAWKMMADEYGLEFNEVLNDQLRGVSRSESLEIILEENHKTMSKEEKLIFTEKKNQVYVQLLVNMSTIDLQKEVFITLNSLKQRGYILAIGSSSKNAKLILNKLGIIHLFDAISDGTNIHKSKPNPEVFECAAEMINLNPKECIVVEDAKAGLIAALASNMDCIAIGDATNSNYATYNIHSFSQLLDILC